MMQYHPRAHIAAWENLGSSVKGILERSTSMYVALTASQRAWEAEKKKQWESTQRQLIPFAISSAKSPNDTFPSLSLSSS